MISAIELAKYVIKFANDRQKNITNLQLQKILYYIAGIYAGIYGKPLFADIIEAWQYGPVVRNVYIEYCAWGSLPLQQETSVSLGLSKSELQVIDNVIIEKLNCSGSSLVNATHQESPWKNHENLINLKPQISFEELYDYFKSHIKVIEWKEKIGMIK